MRITTAQNDIERILFSAQDIAARVRELGAELTERYRDLNPLLVCILKGSALFYSDLCRAIDCPMTMDFIAVSSYGASTTSSGVVRFLKDLDTDITGRHVVIVEDIVDSGLTLQHLKGVLAQRGPASLATVALFDKPAAHAPSLACDYTGFSIGNEFIVGYGLDYAQYYRNLPYVGVLKKEVYAD